MPYYPPAASSGTTYTNATASPPPSPANGDQWWPSDGVGVTFVRSGGAWVPYYAGRPVTDPTAQSWSWVNQGSATITTAAGALLLTTPIASGNQIRGRDKAAPATPYTIEALFGIPLMWGDSGSGFGLFWRNAAAGTLVVFGSQYNSPSPYMLTSKWNSPSSANANYQVPTLPQGLSGLAWLRIADDGTNRTCAFSYNGVAFTQLHSVGRTDFLTADRVGWFIRDSIGATLGLTLLHWKES